MRSCLNRILIFAGLFALALPLFARVGNAAEVSTTNEAPSIDVVLQKALDGDAQAQLTIGAMYERRGSYTNAVRWYRECALQGNAEAQCKMGFFFTLSRGVLRDYTEAVYWFRLSAQQGQPVAQYNLAVAYEKGLGTQQDYHEAFSWYQRAAQSGDAYAQKATGKMYEQGLGTSLDVVEAYKWYTLAAAKGVESAVKLRDALQMQLKPEQLKEAKRRASLFVPTSAKPGNNDKTPDATLPDKSKVKPKDFLQ